MNKEEIFTRWQDPTIEKLQQENKDLQQKNFKLQARADKYKCRIDKAIEFLDKVREENGNEIGQVNYETLIEILGGKE